MDVRWSFTLRKLRSCGLGQRSWRERSDRPMAVGACGAEL